MKSRKLRLSAAATAAAILLGAAATAVRADSILDWSARSEALVTESKLGTPPAIRLMALVQTAAYDAVDTVAKGAPRDPSGAAMDAAVAAAHRAMLTKLMPAQQRSIEVAYAQALATIPAGAAREAGIAAGEHAAAALLARRADDLAAPAQPYRPSAQPGVYVPTVTPAAPNWPQRKPWLMTSPAQFRPAPPPALGSDAWVRDYNEVRAYGARTSTLRSAEQTEIARFWEYSLPAIYHGVVRSVAAMPGRDVVQNARLFAAVAQAMDDALIGVFDAKYHYHFWRPATAIRNGDLDGNDATERDAAWTPFIDNPMHPEYPSAHSILAAAVAAVLHAEIGDGPTPELTTTSPTAPGVTRRWTSVEAFAREVAEARVSEGIHFRTSIEIGAAMGQRIGDLAAVKLLADPVVATETPAPASPMDEHARSNAGDHTVAAR
jgi:hypothetical protein